MIYITSEVHNITTQTDDLQLDSIEALAERDMDGVKGQ